MYEIDTNKIVIDLNPDNVITEILQNVRMCVSNVLTEVRYFNEFSIDGSLLDQPLNTVQGKLSANIIKAIKYGEPRFQVKTITFTGDPLNGQIKPIIRGEINA